MKNLNGYGVVFLSVFFLFFCFKVFAGAPIRLHPNVLRLLDAAKKAQENGQHNEAWKLWLRAKAMAPQLIQPAWLNSAPAKVKELPRRDEVIRGFKENPSATAKEKLKEMLKKDPFDLEIRKTLLENAFKTGDYAEAKRHRSILYPEQMLEAGIRWWRALAILSLLTFIGWQSRELYRDLMKSK